MDEAPFFSVVVVCCNVAPYVGEAIASIAGQTFTDFECLVVIEASTDGTEQAAAERIGEDSRFRIVNLPRSGSASAPRNHGIMHSRGKYLLYVDGDDWIDPDSLERFAAILTEHPELDIVVSGSRNYRPRPDGSLELNGYYRQEVRPGSYESGAALLEAARFDLKWIPSSCLNVYRRALLADNRLFQVVGRLHQDTEWSYRVFLKAGPVQVVPFDFYNYRLHLSSVTHTIDPKTIHDRAENVKSVCAFFAAGDYPARIRPMLANYFCHDFLHAPFLMRKYSGKLTKERLPREECRQALLECLGTREQFRSYCRIVLAAKKSQWPFIPLMYFARWRLLYPFCELVCRLWFDHLHHVYYKMKLKGFFGKRGRKAGCHC